MRVIGDANRLATELKPESPSRDTYDVAGGLAQYVQVKPRRIRKHLQVPRYQKSDGQQSPPAYGIQHSVNLEFILCN